ncbi:MAG: hypothetical protein ACRELB_16920, partial [Polyangiaceae bacterium]
MLGRRVVKLAALLLRLPVPLLGLAIATSAVQASCGGENAQDVGDASADAASTDGDASHDAPSQDSPEDRADGMSYGDGYRP